MYAAVKESERIFHRPTGLTTKFGIKIPFRQVLKTTIILFQAWCTFAALMTTTPLLVSIINRSAYPLPQYETAGSAGMDLRANLEAAVTLAPLERALIPTGLFIELPHGYEAQIRPRSGLAIKRGLTMLNSPGTIDSDYRGEIKCIVVNLSNEQQIIEPGERIAQMVVARHEKVQWQAVEQLPDSERGAGGFGSTGK
jgi:dUTP pyrophosphatase